MTPTLFLAGVILPAKIFFIQHVHTVLIAIRSKNSNSFGNNCINQVFFIMKKIVHGAKHMYSRAAMANFWQTRPPQWRPHQWRAAPTFHSAKSKQGLGLWGLANCGDPVKYYKAWTLGHKIRH